MGGMCARVCPTEVLCEEACVRNTHEDQPVRIGLLQRYATDPTLDEGKQLFERAETTGKRVAVIGGGPAALSCAHRLAVLGHGVTVYSRDEKLGGLNEFGIAAYKTVDEFAQREVQYILDVGGIDVETERVLGEDLSLAELCKKFDAVFVGVGLGGVNELGIDGESLDGVQNAVDYIATLRQADDKSKLPVGRSIVVIGGGMTAIDIGVQSKKLGAERVEIVYRRGPEHMGASRHEQELAQTAGVVIRHWSQPTALEGNGRVQQVTFEHTQLGEDGRLSGTGETWTIEADVVFKAVGQTLAGNLEAEGVSLANSRIAVDENGRTSVDGVWAGGDCVNQGDDLTVTAVQQGKVAAIDIHRKLKHES